MRWTYKKAGVDIEAGAKAVERIKEHARRTFRPEVVSEIGAFGGLFSLTKEKYHEPVLVGATDGVGTKLKLAQKAKRYDTVGIDLVAMCVNDVVAQGAEPLFFLDYIACDKVIPERIEQLIKGISDGCISAGCALLGGETAELPDFYRPGEYDLAGFAVGVVEKSHVIDGRTIAPGDAVLGVASSGLHSNGYSLARKVFPAMSATVLKQLLIPTRIYAKPVLRLMHAVEIHGLAHITGGGLPDNVGRLLSRGVDAELDARRWTRPEIFNSIQAEGNVADEEMFRVFNMGVGLVVILPAEHTERARTVLEENGERAFEIGQVKKGQGRVNIVGL